MISIALAVDRLKLLTSSVSLNLTLLGLPVYQEQ